MRLTARLRHKIVDEYERCQNKAAVSRMFNVDVNTVKYWVDEALRKGRDDLSDRFGGGRKKMINDDGAMQARAMLLSGDYANAKMVAEALHAGGHTGMKVPSATTVIRAAKAISIAMRKPIRAVSGRPKKQLSTTTIAKRLAFCLANSNTDFRTVMFSDRCQSQALSFQVSWDKSKQESMGGGWPTAHSTPTQQPQVCESVCWHYSVWHHQAPAGHWHYWI
jgi:transposase